MPMPGMHGGGDPFCRASFPQTKEAAAQRRDCGESLVDFYRALGMLRKGSTALRNGKIACTAPDSDVLCIVRANEGEDDVVVVAVNRSDKERTVAFDADSPDFGLPPDVRSALRTLNHRTIPLFPNAPENEPTPPDAFELVCERGVVRLAVPPCTAAYWSLS